MTSQIFKDNIPNNLLFNLLEKICLKNFKFFTFNNDSFKKGIYTNDIQDFLKICNTYYHNSKKKYLERKLTYNNFTTILRQICNHNKIKYTTEIKYIKSNYNIVYYIYLDI